MVKKRRRKLPAGTLKLFKVKIILWIPAFAGMTDMEKEALEAPLLEKMNYIIVFCLLVLKFTDSRIHKLTNQLFNKYHLFHFSKISGL